MKFVVYEVWTRSNIIEAENEDKAFEKSEPRRMFDHPEMNLCNWHVVPIEPEADKNLEKLKAVK